VKLFTGENDRIKLLVLLCGEEDELLVKAALGTLAILSSLQIDLDEFKDVDLAEEDRKKLNDYVEENRIICDRIVQVGCCRKKRTVCDIHHSFRCNHSRTCSNICVLRATWNYNFGRCLLFGIS
jgi:hypothetical protein